MYSICYEVFAFHPPWAILTSGPIILNIVFLVPIRLFIHVYSKCFFVRFSLRNQIAFEQRDAVAKLKYLSLHHIVGAKQL